jgi:trimeric autotransporter adhesin
LGHQAGSLIGVYKPVVTFTGGNNTFIGYNANPVVADIFNATALGADASVNASNKIRLGNDQVTVIEGAVPFSSPSDRRLKHNINPSLIGLAFITRLSPMSYTYIADKTNIRHDGLIAQDVEKVMQELGVEFSGLHKSPDGTYSLAYSDFVMPLVNAVKELKQKNEELEARLSALEELKAEITKLKADNALRNSDKK